MCLIVFAWQIAAGTPLMAAANRDEYYDRPTAAAGAWPDHPHVYAGRDLKGGGSWMGISQQGPNGPRFAAVTNIRGPQERRADAPSRGALVADFLASGITASQYLETVSAHAHAYNGFNLVLGDASDMLWYSNRAEDDARNGRPLAPGVYGISNGLLDAPWPKVIRTKAQFASLLFQGAPEDAYFDMLADTSCAPDMRLPDTGVALDLERVLSAVCIDTPGYGTRTSTLAKLRAHGVAELYERTIQ